MLKVPKSPELKRARGYSDPKSIVWADGREVLRGKDWTHRVFELMQRAGNRCQWAESAGGRCPKDADDPHHVKQRSKGRDDRLENLLALCREHHIAIDPRKVRSDRKERRAQELRNQWEPGDTPDVL